MDLGEMAWWEDWTSQWGREARAGEREILLEPGEGPVDGRTTRLVEHQDVLLDMTKTLMKFVLIFQFLWV